jgi:hypothetical protein
MARRVRGSAGGWWRAQLPGLAAVIVFGAAIAAMVRHDRAEGERFRRDEAARVASRRAVFARGHLDETLSLCRSGWRDELGFHHEPVALSWTRQSVDGYFYAGADGGSLLQVRCDAQGVSRGPRVVHPLHDLLPAEAPAEARGEDDDRRWFKALGDLPPAFDEDELALELLRHPVTGQVLSRRWRGGPEGAVAAADPADAPVFPLLAAAPGFPPPPRLPALEPLKRYDWLAQAGAAFDLVAREIPAGALVSEITLEPDSIDVQVAHPTPAFEGRPPQPFGDKEWDEYGIAELSWWYPREIPGFGCATGQPIAAVRAAFDAARTRHGEARLARAWYSCSTAYSNGHDGVWHLVPAR